MIEEAASGADEDDRPRPKKRKFVDAQRIFHIMEPRNLSAAYRFYCDGNLENAHSAKADALATWEIIKSQVDRCRS